MDRETLINEKIARIRAKNEAIKKRHAEVEEDRKRAEHARSSITTQKPPEEGDNFNRPFPGRKPSQGHGPKSNNNARGSFVNDRESREDPRPAGSGVQRQSVHQRLGEKDAPPPDPSYRFLADRMRDGSDEEPDSWRRQRGGDGRRGDGRRGAAPRRGGRGRGRNILSGREINIRPSERFVDDRSNNMQITVTVKNDEQSGEQHKNVRSRRQHQDENLPPRERPLSPEKHDSSSRSSGVQGRLERARLEQRPKQTVQNSGPGQDWRCPDPGCNNKNPSSNPCCLRCGLSWEKANDYVTNRAGRRVREDYFNDAKPAVNGDANNYVWPEPEYQNQEFVGSGSVIDQWTPQEDLNMVPTSQQWVEEPAVNWEMNDMGITDWSEEVMNEIPDSPATGPIVPLPWDAMSQSIPHYATATISPAAQPLPFLPPPHNLQIQFQTQQPQLLIPLQPAEFTSLPQPFVGHQLLTHHQHVAPISHPPHIQTIGRGYMPPHQQRYEPPTQPAGRGYPRNNGESLRRPREPREVTKIPPRFQKQRPAVQPAPPKKSRIPALPRATSSVAPDTSRRLTIFGPPQVLDHFSDIQMSEDLSIPLRLLKTPSELSELRDRIVQVDPALDRFLLIHSLAEDAGAIAKTSKEDVDKGAESDDIANEFCDIILELLDRIPYLKVFISMLTPRFDGEELYAMSCPNNVRKVMNVQIQMRLHGNPRVTLINNDLILDWRENEDRKLKLVQADGRSLTALGFDALFNQWRGVLKTVVAEEQLPEVTKPTTSDAAVEDEKPTPWDEVRSESEEIDTEGLPSLEEVASSRSRSKERPDVADSSDRPEPSDRPDSSDLPDSSDQPDSSDLPDSSADPSNLPPESPVEVNGEVEGPSEGENATTDLVPDASIGQSEKESRSSPELKAENAESEEEVFHEAEDKGFIDDSYCDFKPDEASLPSLGSCFDDAEPEPKSGPVSGIFLEDPYVDPPEENFKEKENEEMMEKEMSQEPENTEDKETKDQETKDQETKDQETKDQETKDQETKDQETKDQETKDQETKDKETKDQETK